MGGAGCMGGGGGGGAGRRGWRRGAGAGSGPVASGKPAGSAGLFQGPRVQEAQAPRVTGQTGRWARWRGWGPWAAATSPRLPSPSLASLLGHRALARFPCWDTAEAELRRQAKYCPPSSLPPVGWTSEETWTDPGQLPRAYGHSLALGVGGDAPARPGAKDTRGAFLTEQRPGSSVTAG